MTRLLFVSGSIGLGHAGRDLAIARALRDLDPDVEIEWLAGDPARRLIADAGETLLHESAMLDETSCAEEVADEFNLNLVSYVSRAQGAWHRSVEAFARAVGERPYDLIVGDESYEIVGAMAKRPQLKTAPFTMIYDFVGTDATTASPRERLIAWRWNRGWCRPQPADLTLFVGLPEDVPDRRFGIGLPNRRRYARRHYAFIGYVFGFDPAEYRDKAAVRAALGYDDRPLVVCSVGGTAIGVDLLRLCAAAFPILERRVPDLRMVIVCGPRIDPATVRAPAGVDVRGYVPQLYEHFAACDAAVVQAGGTTTLELMALRRPFVYLPLEGHFEQQRVVAERLARHRAGHRASISQTGPSRLADLVATQLGRPADWPPIPADGARWAARLIGALAGTNGERRVHAHA
jgi:UDP:flavonoid glycosyltransferase YjiC (YdhE family)